MNTKLGAWETNRIALLGADNREIGDTVVIEIAEGGDGLTWPRRRVHPVAFDRALRAELTPVGGQDQRCEEGTHAWRNPDLEAGFRPPTTSPAPPFRQAGASPEPLASWPVNVFQ
jgi:hypothetical protein